MTSESNKRPHAPELLAPAGSPEALRAAVNNGADAVYLGLSEFNARRGAANFDVQSLKEAARFAHLRGARIYLTANILMLADELGAALSMVDEAWTAGVDAVIVQDLGFMSLLRRELPHVRLHASTQVNAHNAPTVAALASLGVSRVTLARELSVAEIATLAQAAPIELESFVHGSLCYCYSGQCLMSSMIGRRSANRGLCAQPCRLPYALVDEQGARAEVPGRFLLSPKDLAGIALLPALVGSGVAALKIEGRMKSAEYVALVTGVYRQAIDRAVAHPEGFEVLESEWDILEEAFSRGFTTASLTGERREALMSYSRPNNRGVYVGRVDTTEGKHASVALDRSVEADDRIEVWTGRGRFAQPVGEMRVGGKPARIAAAGQRPVIEFERTVGAGDRVFRVANAALVRAARRTFEGRDAVGLRSVPVDARVRLRIGQPVLVELRTDTGTAVAEGPVVEAAKTRDLSIEDVMEHVGRLGGTAYVPRTWEVELEPHVGLGFSTLHAVRRAAVERLDAARLDEWEGRRPAQPAYTQSRRTRPRSVPRVELVAAVGGFAEAEVCLRAGADRVLLAMPAVQEPCALPPGIEPLLPRIVHSDELASLAGWANGRRVRSTTGNLGLLASLVARGAKADADWGVNVVNGPAAEVLAELGAGMIWASPELSGRQLAGLVATSPVPVGATVFGRLELMVAEHCVLQATGACGRTCASCVRRRKRWALVDDKGYRFPVVTDADGRSRVYNSVPLDLTKALAEVIESGVAAVRLELHAEDATGCEEAVRWFRGLLDAHEDGRTMAVSPLVHPATSGHFFRGVK